MELGLRNQVNIKAVFANISPTITGPDEHAPARVLPYTNNIYTRTILTIMCLVGVTGNIYTLIIMNTSVRVTG